jgi:squalene synthase HpnC
MQAADLRTGKGRRDENFPVASILLAPHHRRPILAFYKFARVADDVADHPSLSPAEKMAILERLEAGLDGAATPDPEAANLRSTLATTGVSDEHSRMLLQAFRQDATTNRHHSWLELMDYCAHSAMPVGRFILDLHGESRATRNASDAVCAALQIINHLQDCAQDYKQLNRVYIPLDLLAREGACVEELGAKQASRALRNAIQHLNTRADQLLQMGTGLASQVKSRGLAREIEVITALARSNVARLRVEDPLQGGGRTRKPRALLITLATLIRSVSGRYTAHDKRTAYDPGL